jgi:hypothetical protein
MRFNNHINDITTKINDYLKEAALQPNRSDVSIFEKNIKEVYKEFMKGSKYPRNRTGLGTAMKTAAKNITKSIKDLKVEFKPHKGDTIKAGAMAFQPKHYIEIKFSTKYALFDWLAGGSDFKYWLNNFMNLVKHELVHIEQYRRILKNKGDIDKVLDVLFDMKQKAQDTYDDNMEAYLSEFLEIMAHAKQSHDQFKAAHLNKDRMLELLKTKSGMEELSFESSAFDSYYSYIYPKYPKVWKKFIKTLVEYIQKEK